MSNQITKEALVIKLISEISNEKKRRVVQGLIDAKLITKANAVKSLIKSLGISRKRAYVLLEDVK